MLHQATDAHACACKHTQALSQAQQTHSRTPIRPRKAINKTYLKAQNFFVGRTIQQQEQPVYVSGTENYKISIRVATCLPMLSRYYKFGHKLDPLQNKRGGATASRHLSMLVPNVLNVIAFTTMLSSGLSRLYDPLKSMRRTCT